MPQGCVKSYLGGGGLHRKGLHGCMVESQGGDVTLVVGARLQVVHHEVEQPA